MVTLTITIDDELHEWLCRQADRANQTVEELIEKEVERARESDPENPEFLHALGASLSANRGLLKRLAE